MNQRTLIDRLLSPAGFGLVLLLFLIPFATVSCGVGDEKVDATFTGLDLVVGANPGISGPNIDAESEEQLIKLFQEDYNPEPLMIAAAVLLLVGMAVALIPTAQLRAWASAGTAVVTVILLAITVFLRAPSHVADAIDRFRAAAQVEDPIPTSTTPAIGFWLGAVILVALAGWQGYQAVRAPTAPVPVGTGTLGADPAESPPAAAPPGEAGWPPQATSWQSQDPPTSPTT